MNNEENLGSMRSLLLITFHDISVRCLYTFLYKSRIINKENTNNQCDPQF